MDNALNSSPVIDLQAPSALSSEFIARLERSPRSDHHLIPAILTIERENAEAGQEASAGPPVPPPAISTSAYSDDGQFPYFEASAVVPAHVASDAVAATRCGKAIIKVMRKAFRTKERKPPRPAPSLPAAPLKRAARARAVHSHRAHGGARKAGDDGDGGDGEPPSRTQSDYGVWASPEAYAIAKRCWLLDPLPKPRPGYAFVNVNCEFWRRQFSNLFCTTTGEAERFLSILGPRPASEERLQAALKVMGRGLRHG